MSLGKRESGNQREFWIETDRLATGPGYVFCDNLNRLLVECGFDLFVKQLWQPHCKTGGGPSIPPGIYLRAYIPEPKAHSPRRWTDKPAAPQREVANNRRCRSRAKGRGLQCERSEKVERSFAHVCKTGGVRRTWLPGREKINKRYLIVAAARNLGLLMLNLFGIGKSRTLQAAGDGFRSRIRGLTSSRGRCGAVRSNYGRCEHFSRPHELVRDEFSAAQNY